MKARFVHIVVLLLLLLPFEAIGFSTLASHVFLFRSIRARKSSNLPSLSTETPPCHILIAKNSKVCIRDYPLSAVGLKHPQKTVPKNSALLSTTLLLPPIGILGHAALLSLATIVVKICKKFFSSSDNAVQAGGMLDRCPWPFIFFHDPRQGLKDSQTWTTIVYLALWRCLKLYQAARGG